MTKDILQIWLRKLKWGNYFVLFGWVSVIINVHVRRRQEGQGQWRRWDDRGRGQSDAATIQGMWAAYRIEVGKDKEQILP